MGSHRWVLNALTVSKLPASTTNSQLSMPELPEVETMVRGIRPAVAGRTLQGVRRCRCACKPLLMEPGLRAIRARAVGQTIVSVRRIAKRIVLDLASGDAFVIEPRMTGLMLLGDPPDREHLRIEWSLSGMQGDEPQRLWFWDRRGLGTLRLLSAQQLAEALGPGRLGPDALQMTLDNWQVRLAATGRAIKVALLDQKLVAGIGNLYASEILHLARIHPERCSDLLQREQIERLSSATRQVLETAIRYEGSTLGDGTYRNVLNQNGSYQNEHRVYAREDERCPTCRKATIRRIVQAQRSTFFCPRCQK